MPMRLLSAMRASGVSDFSQSLKSKYSGYRKFMKRTATDGAQLRPRRFQRVPGIHEQIADARLDVANLRWQ